MELMVFVPPVTPTCGGVHPYLVCAAVQPTPDAVHLPPMVVVEVEA